MSGQTITKEPLTRQGKPLDHALLSLLISVDSLLEAMADRIAQFLELFGLFWPLTIQLWGTR